MIWVGSVWAVGCAQSDDDCAWVIATAPVAFEENYLGLSDAQMAAIAVVRGTVDGKPAVCSAVWVHPERLLTARHCTPVLSADDVHVELGETEVTVKHIEPHPVYDLAALTVDRPPTAVRAFVVHPSAASSVDRRILVAAAGRTHRHAPGRRHFSVQWANANGDAHLALEALGSHGVCAGDSGGAVLMRTDEGQIAVAGIITRGSANCGGLGQALRLDRVADWLSEQGVESGTRSAPCDALEPEGRCFDDLAVWCEDGSSLGKRCEAGSRCGWSVSAGGYRCIETEEDPCGGVDQLGVCRDERTLIECVHGERVLTDCDAHGTCLIDPGSARAVCGRYEDAAGSAPNSCL